MRQIYEIFKFQQGVELIVQKEPIRLLYIRQNGKFITYRYLTFPEFTDSKEAFFMENSYDGKAIMYYNYTDEQLTMIKERLEKLDTLPSYVPNMFEVIDEIELDFSDRRGYRQEWESYSKNNQLSLKMDWHSEIMREVEIKDMNDATNKIPFIIKNSWLKYNGLKEAWRNTDEDIQEEIIQAWRKIIQNAYEKKVISNN